MKLLLAVALVAASAGAAQIEPDRTEWSRTDFSKRTVDLSEIESGGPPKDGIPAIDRPRFVGARAALAGDWNAKNLGVAAFVQDFAKGEILQATALPACL